MLGDGASSVTDVAGAVSDALGDSSVGGGAGGEAVPPPEEPGQRSNKSGSGMSEPGSSGTAMTAGLRMK